MTSGSYFFVCATACVQFGITIAARIADDRDDDHQLEQREAALVLEPSARIVPRRIMHAVDSLWVIDRLDDHVAVDVELDEPTRSYIAALREIDECLAERELLAVLHRTGLRSSAASSFGAFGIVDDHLRVAVADDEVHRLGRLEVLRRGLP